MGDEGSSIFRQRIKDEEILALLDEPVGSPLPLTREQAIEIVRAGIGARPDLPTGKEYVRSVRKLWRGLVQRD